MSNRPLKVREEQKVKDELQDQLKHVYTPGTPITEPALFAGRQQLLETVRRTRGTGMNYVIQGQAGLGKTSFARQLFSGTRAFWHTASGDTDFVSIFLAMLLSIDGAVTEAERTELKKAGVSVGAGAIGTKAEFGTELNVKQVQVAAQKLDLNFVLDRVVKREKAIDSIVIDEFQRIKDSKIHTQVVEVIKGLADRGANVTVALVGVTTRGEELVKDPEYPNYLGRHVTVIRLRPMTESETLEIFQLREISFNVTFPPELQQKIGWISCGYPYIVHKLALQSCFAWLVRSTAQIVRNLVVRLRKHILRQKEIQAPNVKSLSVSIEPDDVIFAVRMFVNEYEGNHPLATESLQGLGQTERERLVSGSVDETQTDDQYFLCYGRAKEYLKSVGSTDFIAGDAATIDEQEWEMRDATNQEKVDSIVADVDNPMTSEDAGTNNQDDEGRKVRKVKRTSAGPKAVDIAVVTIKPEEYAAVLRHLESPENPTDLGRKRNRFAWRVGYMGSQWGTKYSVVVGMAGTAGTNVAQSAVHATVEVFRPRYVLVIGIAGGLVSEKERKGPVDSWPIRKGDVVVSSVIYGYEYGKVDEGGFLPRHDLTYQVDAAILRAAQALPIIDSQWPDFLKIQRPASTVHSPRVFAAPVASGDKVVDDPSASFFEAVWNSWPKLRAVEMEGAGAAAAVKDIVDSGKSLGLAMIRGISDIPTSPGDRCEESTGQTVERDSWTDYASETAATFAARLISKAWPERPRSSV